MSSCFCCPYFVTISKIQNRTHPVVLEQARIKERRKQSGVQSVICRVQVIPNGKCSHQPNSFGKFCIKSLKSDSMQYYTPMIFCAHMKTCSTWDMGLNPISCYILKILVNHCFLLLIYLYTRNCGDNIPDGVLSNCLELGLKSLILILSQNSLREFLFP